MMRTNWAFVYTRYTLYNLFISRCILCENQLVKVILSREVLLGLDGVNEFEMLDFEFDEITIT